MEAEYEVFLTVPDESQSTGPFYVYVNNFILEPLSKVGYYLINHYLGSVWDLENGGVKISLEYLDHCKCFRLQVDWEENAEEVIANVLEHTPLQLWQE